MFLLLISYLGRILNRKFSDTIWAGLVFMKYQIILIGRISLNFLIQGLILQSKSFNAVHLTTNNFLTLGYPK